MTITFPTLNVAVDPADNTPNLTVTWDAVATQENILVERDDLNTGVKTWWDGDSWEATQAEVTSAAASIDLPIAGFTSSYTRYRISIHHRDSSDNLLLTNTTEFYVAAKPTLSVNAPPDPTLDESPVVSWQPGGYSQEAYRVAFEVNSQLPGDLQTWTWSGANYDTGWVVGSVLTIDPGSIELPTATQMAAVVQVRAAHNNYSLIQKKTFTVTPPAETAPTVSASDYGDGIAQVQIAPPSGTNKTYRLWRTVGAGAEEYLGEFVAPSGTYNYYDSTLPKNTATTYRARMLVSGGEYSLSGSDSVTITSDLKFTINQVGQQPIVVRQASLDIVRDGSYVGTPHRVAGRDRPVVVYGAWNDFSEFDLIVNVLSRTEHDAVMAVLKSGAPFYVTTHQSDSYFVSVTGQIKARQVKAQPAAGEPYPTRYAWEITCKLTEAWA